MIEWAYMQSDLQSLIIAWANWVFASFLSYSSHVIIISFHFIAVHCDWFLFFFQHTWHMFVRARWMDFRFFLFCLCLNFMLTGLVHAKAHAVNDNSSSSNNKSFLCTYLSQVIPNNNSFMSLAYRCYNISHNYKLKCRERGRKNSADFNLRWKVYMVHFVVIWFSIGIHYLFFFRFFHVMHTVHIISHIHFFVDWEMRFVYTKSLWIHIHYQWFII